jgi:hypothetical protein
MALRTTTTVDSRFHSSAASAKACTFSGGTFGSIASWLGLTMRLGPMIFFYARHIRPDVVRCAKSHELLRVNAAHERNAPLEVPGQSLGVHIRCLGLQRVQAVDTGVDQVPNDFVDGTTGV